MGPHIQMGASHTRKKIVYVSDEPSASLSGDLCSCEWKRLTEKAAVKWEIRAGACMSPFQH